jgi:hypothetical protein
MTPLVLILALVADPFDSYAQAVESRLARQRQSPATFLAPSSAPIECLSPPGNLHHWRGTAFVPNAKAADFDRLLRDFPGYPKYFAPQVLETKLLSDGDPTKIHMRVRQKHVITVVLDITYDVTVGQTDPQHRYSTARSTRITEVDTTENHGYLQRLNNYWSYEERDAGLYLQIESISMSRAIPLGLEWMIRGYVESIPRDSLEFTLNAVRKALQR